jgi:hypothetical protein
MFSGFSGELSPLITVWFLVRVQAGPPIKAGISRIFVIDAKATASVTATETMPVCSDHQAAEGAGKRAIVVTGRAPSSDISTAPVSDACSCCFLGDAREVADKLTHS